MGFDAAEMRRLAEAFDRWRLAVAFDRWQDRLTPRERRVLELRYGLEDGRSRTLEEVGRDFNVTRERIRQIERTGLLKLGLRRVTRR